MGMRKVMRLRLALPVRVSGENADGESFEQNCTIVDLTVNGLCIEGLTQTLRRGAVISVSYRAKSVPARGMWTGKMGSESQGHVGLQVDWNNLWGRAISQIPGDGFPNSTNKHRVEPDSWPPPSDDSGPALLARSTTEVPPRDAKLEQRVHLPSTWYSVVGLVQPRYKKFKDL